MTYIQIRKIVVYIYANGNFSKGFEQAFEKNLNTKVKILNKPGNILNNINR